MLTPEQQAADENTSFDKLRELATSSDPVVRQNLAMNPNTPAVVLVELAKQFPRHLFKNPAIDLLLLENPNLLANSVNTLCSLVKRSIAPLPMLKYVANSTDERLQLAATMNAELSKLALAPLAQSQNPRVTGAAQMHVNWANQEDVDWEAIAEAAVAHTCNQTWQSSTDSFAQAMMQLSTMRELAAEIPEKLMRSIRAKQTDTQPIPEAELEQLVQANTLQTLSRVAGNPHTPTHLLEEMAESAGKLILTVIADNPNTPVHLLERWVTESDDDDFLSAVALNSSTPPYLLEKLAGHPRHQKVSAAVACNSNTPVNVLDKLIDLAENPPTFCWEYVLQAVARSSRLSAAAFEKLSNYPDPRVRTTVANNPHAPRSLVMRLLAQFEREGGYCLIGYVGVEEIIVTNPHLSTNFLNRLLSESFAGCEKSWHELIKGQYQYAVSVIAAHPNLHSEKLRYLLLDHEDHNIRRAAATNPNAAKYLVEHWGLSVLDTMPSYIVEIIAQNLDAPDCLLQALLKRQEASVRVKAARNPCLSDSVLEQWEASKDYIPGEVEKALTSEQLLYSAWETRVPASSRLIILLDHRSPSGLLAKLARSASWLERYAIAKHSNTPKRIRQRLTQDANHAVRAAAIANSQ